MVMPSHATLAHGFSCSSNGLQLDPLTARAVFSAPPGPSTSAVESRQDERPSSLRRCASELSKGSFLRLKAAERCLLVLNNCIGPKTLLQHFFWRGASYLQRISRDCISEVLDQRSVMLTRLTMSGAKAHLEDQPL